MRLDIEGLIALSEKSSFVKTFNKKLSQRKGGAIPIDNTQIGHIILNWIYEEDSKLYRCIWKSRFTNSVTTLSRLGIGRYMVSRSSPRLAEPSAYMFADKEPAIQAFFCNLDLQRIKDSDAADSRKWCAEHLKRAEGLKSLMFNPRKTKGAQTSFNKTILIGKNKPDRPELAYGAGNQASEVVVRCHHPADLIILIIGWWIFPRLALARRAGVFLSALPLRDRNLLCLAA